LLSGLSAFITAESTTRPVVIVFDDVQWCDESSAAALHYVVRMNRRQAVFAVLAVRDGELQDNAVLQQTLSGLRHERLLREIKLFPLSAAATAQLVRQCCPEVDAERLHQACRGNPLLAIELARAERDGAGASSLD